MNIKYAVYDWSNQSKSTRSSLIVHSESNDDLLKGQIFIHVTILLYLLIAKQGTCIFVWFLHFFSRVPKSTLQNTHTLTCKKNFTCTNYCLYASPWSYSVDKDCFSNFCTCWTKKITTPVWYLVLDYLSSKLDSGPAYLRRTSKIIQDNPIESAVLL